VAIDCQESSPKCIANHVSLQFAIEGCGSFDNSSSAAASFCGVWFGIDEQCIFPIGEEFAKRPADCWRRSFLPQKLVRLRRAPLVVMARLGNRPRYRRHDRGATSSSVGDEAQGATARVFRRRRLILGRESLRRTPGLRSLRSPARCLSLLASTCCHALSRRSIPL